MSLACVGSTRSVPATLGLPPLTGVSFPRLHCSGCRFLYRLWALGCVHLPGPNISGSGSQVLHKDADLVGPSFCAFPGEQLREPGAWWAHSPQVQCDFSPPWPRLFLGTLCLFWGADLWLRPSRQMSAIQNLRKSLVRNWKPVCSLVEDDASGVEFASFWLWLAPTSPLPPVGMAGPQRTRTWQPTSVFVPGKSHEQSILSGYSPWSFKDMDTIEQLSMHTV